MSNPEIPETQTTPDNDKSFGELLSQYERSHARHGDEGSRQVEGTVIAVIGEQILVDVGQKIEGVLLLSALAAGESVKPGDRLPVTIKGRNEDGYYELSRLKIAQPRDWTSLKRALDEKQTISATVTALVKGGLSVDVGVRAFLPASRSGTRDAGELEKLVGQEIRCRIVKLEIEEEDVVVDRRAVIEEEERSNRERRYSEIKEGDTLHGEVRSLTDYGAFVDLGEVDGLLHIGDISWSRIDKPSDVLSVGQHIEAKVLKIDPEKRRISLGLKQLQPHPWDAVAGTYHAGDRVRGTVTRVADFGAFVEVAPGVEGLIHISEMSWSKKARKAGDVVKPGENVEAVVLGVNVGERRLSLGLKQTLGDPWTDAQQRFAAGTIVEGPITSFTKFGAFVQVAEGVEGMVHISEIGGEKRLQHPQDVLKLGQQVKAQVLEVDPVKRQLRLSIKRVLPVSMDEYIAGHEPGDRITGRVLEVSGLTARVELGEGIEGACRLPSVASQGKDSPSAGKADLSSLTSMLQARWKGGGLGAPATQQESLRPGQIRGFRISKLDPASKTIELEMA